MAKETSNISKGRNWKRLLFPVDSLKILFRHSNFKLSYCDNLVEYHIKNVSQDPSLSSPETSEQLMLLQCFSCNNNSDFITMFFASVNYHPLHTNSTSELWFESP